jgi:hypothetical protein
VMKVAIRCACALGKRGVAIALILPPVAKS